MKVESCTKAIPKLLEFGASLKELFIKRSLELLC